MVLAALLNLFLTPFFIIGGPFILRITMGSSDTMYGVGMGLINAATILVAFSVGYFGKKLQVSTLYKPYLLITVLLLPMAISVSPFLLNMGYMPSFLLFTAGAIPVAMVMTILSNFVIAKVQKKTPNENLGKVMAIITAVSQCAAPIGQLLYGALFEIFDTNVIIPTVMAAVFMLGISVLARQILKNEQEVCE